VKCLAALEDDSWLWHKRLGHANFDLLSKLSNKGLVRGLSTLKKSKEVTCDECKKNKQVKSFFHSMNGVSTSKPLQLLHMDLFGPMSTSSLNGKYHAFVIVDNFSRFILVLFLTHKSDAFNFFKHFCKKVKKEIGFSIIKIRSDHGGEFENENFIKFCLDHGITHTFSTPRTPQQNGDVERKIELCKK